MDITFDLSPQLETRLRRLLARRDEEGVRRLLAEALAPLVEKLLGPASANSDDEFETLLDQLAAEAGDHLPSLPNGVVRREGIYGDHP